MAAAVGAGGSCPSGSSEPAAVCGTGEEQFSQREPEIMIYINGLSNELAKIDSPACMLKVCSFSCFPAPLRPDQA